MQNSRHRIGDIDVIFLQAGGTKPNCSPLGDGPIEDAAALSRAVHLALAKNLTPYRAAAHVTGSISRPGLAALNDMVTGQAAVIAVIDQFEILVFAMLIVSPLVLFLRKPRPAN
jgi:hypothetical protein